MIRLHALLIAFLLASGILVGQDLQQSLQAEYQGKTFRIRGFYQDANLHFAQDGTLVGEGHLGSWTVSAIEIKNIKLSPESVEITGQRVVEVADKSGLRATRVKSKMKIKIDDAAKDEQSVRASLSRVFVDPKQPLVDLVPACWRAFLEGDANHHLTRFGPPPIKECTDPTMEHPCRVEGPILPPHVISTPDPTYTKLAKQNGYQGTSVLWVEIDETGTPLNIEIAKPLGFGLDEQAVEAVSHWRFMPATRDDKPVPVQINVEVNFRLY